MSLLSAPPARHCGFKPREIISHGRRGPVDRFLRDRLIARLRRLESGRLRLRDGASSWDFGPLERTETDAEIRVTDSRFYRAVAVQGSLGAADAYLNGWWSCNDLVTAFRLMIRNAAVLARMDGLTARCFRRMVALGRWRQRNTLNGSRRNIAAHYDLGEDFYSLFLDETMTYSAGVFQQPGDSLVEASREKYDRICRKLNLTPQSHLLEIGTGWGGFAVHAARNYGCRVTTTTISRRQYEYARNAVRQAGLDGRVNVLCDDYRTLTGSYDHIVSIEMIESVGHEYLDGYFGHCSRLLRPDGMLLLQAITMPDNRYEHYRRSVDFIQQHVFPGGCLPSVAAMANAIGRTSDLRFLHLEDFGSHYAATLAHWRVRFWQQIEHVRALGFDERFIRLWHYYLCYCEAGFLENQIGVAQILLGKPGCHRPSLDDSNDFQPFGGATQCR